mmetsp:Transcript_95455/g.165804  ORF Transcript_95455/g.165804 Transcript_95455/m.165804 type:complete len:139 (+) Transcript_95455:86-502(+)
MPVLFFLLTAGLLQSAQGQCKDSCTSRTDPSFQCGACAGKCCAKLVALVQPGCANLPGVDAQACEDLGDNLQAMCEQATQASGSCYYSYSVKCYMACNGKEECTTPCNDLIDKAMASACDESTKAANMTSAHQPLVLT